MIRLSPRESALAVITLAAILGGLFWWGGEARLARWKETGQTAGGLKTRLHMAQQLLSRRAEMEERLDAMLRALPRHPADKDVTAELLKMIETTAADHGLSLTRREPEREKAAGELYEVAIHCNWEGSLQSLVYFLYAIQGHGAILDVRALTVTAGRSGTGALTGNFTIVCAYTRARTSGAAAADRHSVDLMQRTHSTTTGGAEHS